MSFKFNALMSFLSLMLSLVIGFSITKYPYFYILGQYLNWGLRKDLTMICLWFCVRIRFIILRTISLWLALLHISLIWPLNIKSPLVVMPKSLTYHLKSYLFQSELKCVHIYSDVSKWHLCLTWYGWHETSF